MRLTTAKSPAVLPSDPLVPLESILCTEDLRRRPPRPPDYETENRTLTALAQALADSPQTILQTMAEKMLEVFQMEDAIESRQAVEKLNMELSASERRFREMIDALPAAIYTTDAEGRLTHFNPACIELSGRTPELGTDHWCVTWKLYRPDGTPMPHEECPVAVALKEGRTVRGAEAIAERPDGTRIWFAPYPTR